jgi:hypothetical protein
MNTGARRSTIVTLPPSAHHLPLHVFLRDDRFSASPFRGGTYTASTHPIPPRPSCIHRRCGREGYGGEPTRVPLRLASKGGAQGRRRRRERGSGYYLGLRVGAEGRAGADGSPACSSMATQRRLVRLRDLELGGRAECVRKTAESKSFKKRAVDGHAYCGGLSEQSTSPEERQCVVISQPPFPKKQGTRLGKSSFWLDPPSVLWYRRQGSDARDAQSVSQSSAHTALDFSSAARIFLVLSDSNAGMYPWIEYGFCLNRMWTRP